MTYRLQPTNRLPATSHIALYVIVYFLYYVDTIYIDDAKQTKQSVTLDDNEKTTDDVSPATNKSVARTHINNIICYLIFGIRYYVHTIYIGDAEQTNNQSVALDDNEKTTDDIRPQPTNRLPASIYNIYICYRIFSILYYVDTIYIDDAE